MTQEPGLYLVISPVHSATRSTWETCIPLVKMAGTGDRSLWCIEVTDEQKMTIQALFAHSGWELIEHPYPTPQVEAAPQSTRKKPRRVSQKAQADDSQLQEIEVLDTEVPESAGGQHHTTTSQGQPEPQPTTSSHSDTECPHCFFDPCVTSRPQKWLGKGNPPGRGNSAVRKTLYKKFWKVLNDRLAWYDPRYIDKKNRMWQVYLDGLDENNCWVPGRHSPGEQSVREIMPDCVLHQVRQLYPNLPKVPYMDHKFF
ncbi:uncharacterized protein LOC144876560 [Branchiostoma floridae x Branchiostoma japonicum]